MTLIIFKTLLIWHSCIFPKVITKTYSEMKKCMLMGYEENSKAYWLFDPKCRKFVISWNVFFDETKIGTPRLATTLVINNIIFPLIENNSHVNNILEKVELNHCHWNANAPNLKHPCSKVNTQYTLVFFLLLLVKKKKSLFVASCIYK